jgi:hypothetical protein
MRPFLTRSVRTTVVLTLRVTAVSAQVGPVHQLGTFAVACRFRTRRLIISMITEKAIAK